MFIVTEIMLKHATELLQRLK